MTATTAKGTTSASTTDMAHAWRVLGVAGIGGFLAAINTSTISVALPTLARHFGASASAASWTLLSYLLVATVLVFVFGRVTDMLGRRFMYLLGLVLLTVASLACGLAPSIGWLIAFRCVQAVGAAALLCNITALVTDAFPRDRLSTGLGINATIASLAQVLGPVVGGVLASGLGWRSVFWFNVPIGLAGLVWAAANLPRGAAARREPFDFVGAVLAAVALGGLVLALSEGEALGWTSPVVAGGLIAFVVLTPVFLRVEAHRRYPLVELGLLAQRARGLAYVSLLFMSMAYFAVVTLVALYLQAARGMAPYEAGLRVLYVAVAMSVAAPLAGRLGRRFGARVLGSGGIALTAAGLFGLAALTNPAQAPLLMAVCLVAIGAGAGLFMTPNTNAIMISVTANRRGIANGVRQTTQNAGFALSTALSVSIATAGLAAGDKEAAYAGTLSSLAPHTLAAFTAGYRWALVALGVACLVALTASLARGGAPAASRHPAPTGAPSTD